MRIGFIGAGNMAQALISGLGARGYGAADMMVCDPDPQQLTAVRNRFGCATSSDNVAAARDTDALVLAVKPQMLIGVLEGLRTQLQQHMPLLVSVVAGVRTAAFAGALGTAVRIVRAMPNRPAFVGAGVTGLYAPQDTVEADRNVAQRLLQAVGETVWVPREDDLDAVTAVSGSGPAYFFLLIETLEQSAQELGLDAQTARTLAIHTAYGAGVLAHAGEFSPAQLREQVTSRGGTTAAALTVLEDADLRGILRRAVTAACRRSAELAQQFGS